MHKKALTVAIAGALAAPMAAHAVDVTLSGHVNRALFITDSDSGTSSSVKDNGSSGTRIRVTGTGEMMDGGSAGVLLEYSAGSTLGLRYADVWFSGDYGKVSIGQGDQGGEGSVYKGGAAVLGTGHGQDTNGVASNYYTSLDGGAGRNERLRYDSPSVGPVSAAVSVGNGDQVSAGISLSQSFGDTSFAAGIGTVQSPGRKSTVSGSAGVSLASGISISGAWGVGRAHAGAVAVAGTAAVPAHFRMVDTTEMVMLDSDAAVDGVETAAFDTHMDALRARILAGAAHTADADSEADGEVAKELKRQLFAMTEGCNLADESGIGGPPVAPAVCNERMYPAAAAVEGTPPQIVDPSFFQVAVSYAFGDTSAGVSWYQSNDKHNDGSQLVAIGAGVDHNLPKLATNVYAAIQNYSVEDGDMDTDDTVVMLGVRVKF